MRFVLVLLLALLTALPVYAVNPNEVLSDPVLEERARGISAKLRCLVCQNQSIDESDAQFARDLRVLVRERLSEGDSDGAAIDFIVARYGEFILLKPRLAVHTVLLWAAPFIFLIIGIAFLILQRKKALVTSAKLTAEEEERLNSLLK